MSDKIEQVTKELWDFVCSGGGDASAIKWTAERIAAIFETPAIDIPPPQLAHKPQRPCDHAPGEYIVRVSGYEPCRLVSRKVHRGEVQVQFQNGVRRWFLSSKVRGAEKLP